MNVNKKIHNTKRNFSDLYLRQVLVGLKSFIQDKIKITYTSEEQGEYVHTIPFYYKLGADKQFLIDSFIDDVPDKRVHSNTDITPRSVIGFDSWQYNVEEFTNPTVWYTIPEIDEKEEELISMYRQIKFVPLKISGTFEFTLDTIFEQWSIWEEFVASQFNYSYFTYEYKYITLQAQIEYGNNTTNQIKFDGQYAHEERIVLPFDFTITTHFPIIDKDARFNNKGVYWENYYKVNEKLVKK